MSNWAINGQENPEAEGIRNVQATNACIAFRDDLELLYIPTIELEMDSKLSL